MDAGCESCGVLIRGPLCDRCAAEKRGRESDPPVFLAPIPEGIRVNCGDLHRVKEMTPKAMRGFALRLLEMAEGRE